MSKKLYLKNISGQNFYFPEISIKCRVGPDPDKVHCFTEEEVEKCDLLSNLITSGSMMPTSKPQNEENVEFLSDLNSPENVEERKPTRERLPANPFPEPPPPGSKNGSYKERLPADPLPEKNKEKPDFSSEPEIHSFGDVTASKTSGSKKGNDEITKTKKDPNALELWWRGPANDMGGYGKMNRYCLQGLHSRDMHIQLSLHNIPSIRNTIPNNSIMDEMISNQVDRDAPSVWAIMPPKFPDRHGKKYYFTMMESNVVHKSFEEKLNYADEVWVPSQFNVDALEESGFKKPIYKIPLGVDNKLYKPFDVTPQQRKKFNIQTKGFSFLSVFGWSLRKGVDVLFKSYLKTFTKDDDVSLVIVSRLNGSSSNEDIKKIRNEIASYIKRFCPKPENHPHIVHMGVGIPEVDLPIIYNMCDCFVLPSRGEGFGLPYMEAGACGIPVIATKCSGQLEFLNDDNSFLVDIEGYGIEKQEIKEISSYYQDVPFAVLGKTCTDQLCDAMKEVYNNYSIAKDKSDKLLEEIFSNFLWKNTVDKIYERVAQ